MPKTNLRDCSFSKNASSVNHRKNVVRTVTRGEVIALNKTIEPKIRQNEKERSASMHAAARCIVGGKQMSDFDIEP